MLTSHGKSKLMHYLRMMLYTVKFLQWIRTVNVSHSVPYARTFGQHYWCKLDLH